MENATCISALNIMIRELQARYDKIAEYRNIYRELYYSADDSTPEEVFYCKKEIEYAAREEETYKVLQDLKEFVRVYENLE